MDPEAQLDQALAAACDQGELGLQVAAYVGGQLLIDRSVGLADPSASRMVDDETVFLVFSASKGVVATAVNMLVDRGCLGYETRIGDLWPEFSRHGKGPITVSDVLFHAAGIPQMPARTSVEAMCDVEGITAAMTELEPLWPTGQKHAYHAYTFGWILGEVVRRADPARRDFPTFVHEEICRPLGIEGLWFGVPEGRIADVATVDDSTYGESKSELLLRAIPEHLRPSREVFMRRQVLQSVHPAAGGVCNAKSLARLYAALCAAPDDPQQLLSASARRAISSGTVDVWDECLESTMRRSYGYVVADQPGAVLGPREEGGFGHVGAGGSIGWANPALGAGFAILKNKMTRVRGGDQNYLEGIADAMRQVVVSTDLPQHARSS
jgi:CubicO group peptidase (beta-lactamase class C family)